MPPDNPDDGGPAFPALGSSFASSGMTLRQWYATFAPQPTEAEVNAERGHDGARDVSSVYDIRAVLRFKHADAMILASTKLES